LIIKVLQNLTIKIKFCIFEKNYPMIYRFILIFIMFNCANGMAQYDTLHFLPPVYVSDAIKTANNSCRDHYIVLSTIEHSVFQVSIVEGNGSVFSNYTIITGSQSSTGVFNLSRSTPLKIKFNNTGVNVDNIFSKASLNTVLSGGSYELSGPKPFFVNVRHLSSSQGASLSCKGSTALGTNFFAGFQASGVGNGSISTFCSHFISIMATRNNTNITIDGFRTGVTFFGQPSSGSPATSNTISITLNAGESYIVAQSLDLIIANSAIMDDYNGIHISSDKDIAVNTGSWLSPSTSGNSRDIGMDQLIPSAFAGTKYALIKGNNTSSSLALEKVIVISTQSGTTNLSFGSGPAMTLTGAGDYAIISSNTYWKTATSIATGSMTHHNLAISSDEPILVFQTLFGSTSGATSSMNLIPPLADCIGSDSIYIPDAEQFGNSSSISIVSPTTSTITVRNELNTLLLTIPPSAENLPGSIILDYRTTSYSIPNSSTDIFVTGDEKFSLGFLGASNVIGGAGYMSAFSDKKVNYASTDPLFIGNGTTKLDLCEGVPSYISILDSDSYDSFQWYKDDVIIPGATDDSLIIMVEGIYKSIAKYCSLSLESTNVIVDEFGSPGEQGFSTISVLYEPETFDGFSNGSNIVDWDEQSKEFNTASTIANGPSVNTNRFNLPGFHPVPFFDSSNDEYLKSKNLVTGINGLNAYSFFIVLKDSNSTNGSTVLNFENSVSGAKLIKTSSGYSFTQPVTSVGGSFNAGVNISTDEFIILSGVSDGTTITLYANGKQGSISTTSNTIDANGKLIIGAGHEGSTDFFNGFIAELLVFETSISPSNRQIVETYYGVKYGITFDVTNDEVGIDDGDYVSNNGSVVWDYSVNSAYHNSVAGLGLDECGRLRQWQNETNLNDDFVTIGIGDIFATAGSNPNSLNTDNTYFLWGRNTEAFDSNGETDFGLTINSELIETRVSRVWKTQETGNTGTLRIQFDLGTGSSTINDLAESRLLVDTDDTFATGAFSISPTSFNNATGIVNFDHDFDGVTGFFFTLGSVNLTATPLPIKLLNFEVEKNSDNLVSKWESSSELNNAYYSIHKSLDGVNWIFVEDISGAGNSNTNLRYNSIDTNPFNGLSYYKLSQTDFDGQVTELGVRKVVFEFTASVSINIYPNPSKGIVNIKSNISLTGEIVIRNSIGQLLQRNSIVESMNKQIDLSGFPKGVYFIEFLYSGNRIYKKISID